MKKQTSSKIAKDRLTKVLKKDRAINRSSRKIARSIVMSGILLVGMQSCGNFYASMGTAEAIRAHNDLVTGAISEARTPAGQKSAHYQMREIQESRKTAWEGLKGLFSSNKGGK